MVGWIEEMLKSRYQHSIKKEGKFSWKNKRTNSQKTSNII